MISCAAFGVHLAAWLLHMSLPSGMPFLVHDKG